MFENQFYIEFKDELFEMINKKYCNDISEHILSFIKIYNEDEYYNEQYLLMCNDDIKVLF